MCSLAGRGEALTKERLTDHIQMQQAGVGWPGSRAGILVSGRTDRR
jgi:hypothetical protein